MKLTIDPDQGDRHTYGHVTYLYYPNGGIVALVNDIVSSIVYTVHSIDKNNQPAVGKDVVFFGYSNQEYYVKRIWTHDGIHIDYDENGKTIGTGK